MKKVRYSIYAGILALSMSSCINEVLDKQPLDIISEEVVWNDETLMDAFLVELYRATSSLTQDSSGLQDGWGSSAYSGNIGDQFGNSAIVSGPQVMNHITDEAGAGWGAWSNGVGCKLSNIGIGGGLLEHWEGPYKVIRAQNKFMGEVESWPNEEFKTKRTGEARFLRAFNYFAMVKRYGGVPLILKVQSLDDPEEELYPKRNSEKEIYDFIISELDQCIKELPASNDAGRCNKWAALAFQCRAALYAGSIAQFGKQQLNGLLGFPASDAQGYYQKSYNAAKQILNEGPYALYNKYPDDKGKNFHELFIEKNHSEAIMVVQHDGKDAITSTGNGWTWDFQECPHPHSWGCGNTTAPYLEFVDEFENIDGSDGTMDRAKVQQGEWTVQELYGNKDPRFWGCIWTQDMPWKGIVVDFCPGGYQNPQNTSFYTGFGVLKYTDEEADNMQWLCRSKTDYQVFRLGEVYLNLAEAAFELGKASEALDAVNKIRERAGICNLSTITREKIRHERKIELAFEGHRYWDMRRWRIAVETLDGKNFTGIRYDYGSETGKYKISFTENYHGNSTCIFKEQHYYLPITLSRTGANPNLEENPGYK